MSRVAHHPLAAFAAALGAVGVLSIMDAVMKHLVLAIGIFAVSIWRALASLVISGDGNRGQRARRCAFTW